MKIIKKSFNYPCYYCRPSIRTNMSQKVYSFCGTIKQRKRCKVCKGTGFFEDEIFYHIITDKRGHKYAFEGDTIK